MKRRSSSSNFISSFNDVSNVNNLESVQQNVDSVNASSQGNLSSSTGWIGQSGSIGSSHTQVIPEELNAEHGCLPSSAANIVTSQSLEEMHSEPNGDENLGTGLVTIGPSTSQTGTSDAFPQKLDLNVAYEDSHGTIHQEIGNGTIRQEIGTNHVNQASILEGNTEIFDRSTRQRINPANEQYLPSSSMSSLHGSTSQTLQPSYGHWFTSPSSSSTSSVSPVIPASGSDVLWQEENGQYIPRSTSVQSMLVVGTERGSPGPNLITSRGSPNIPRNTSVQNMLVPGNTSVQSMLVPGTETGSTDQNLITSRAIPRNYRSRNGTRSVQLSVHQFAQHNVARGFQNGFTGGVHLSSTTPGFPPRNMAEEYAERLSDVVNNSRMRLAGSGSGGQVGYLPPPSSASVRSGGQMGYLPPPSSASVTLRGLLESRLGNPRALEAFPRLRSLMIRAEGHNAVMPPILPPLQPLVAAQWRARLLVHRALGALHTTLQYNEDGMIIHGPAFYGGHDVHEDLRLDVDNMSYEELLALEDQIGNVTTGLSKEAIMGSMRRRKYQSIKLGPPVEEEPCCICQEEYVDGEELGKLDCSHDFHFNCIKTWLLQKNTCPICKATALAI